MRKPLKNIFGKSIDTSELISWHLFFGGRGEGGMWGGGERDGVWKRDADIQRDKRERGTFCFASPTPSVILSLKPSIFPHAPCTTCLPQTPNANTNCLPHTIDTSCLSHGTQWPRHHLYPIWPAPPGSPRAAAGSFSAQWRPSPRRRAPAVAKDTRGN